MLKQLREETENLKTNITNAKTTQESATHLIGQQAQVDKEILAIKEEIKQLESKRRDMSQAQNNPQIDPIISPLGH